jgi:hypothetical protein
MRLCEENKTESTSCRSKASTSSAGCYEQQHIRRGARHTTGVHEGPSTKLEARRGEARRDGTRRGETRRDETMGTSLFSDLRFHSTSIALIEIGLNYINSKIRLCKHDSFV